MNLLHYDVIVVGGGPAGIAAALAAARTGASSLLIEKNAYVGGCAASGLPFLNFFNKNGEQVIRGIGQELIERLQQENGALEHIKTSGGHVDSVTMIDPEWVKITAEEMLLESGCNLLYHSFVCKTRVEDNRIISIIVANKGGLTEMTADCFVDATGDGDLAAFSGEEYQMGNPVDGYTQAMSLVFRMVNVDVEKVSSRFPKSPIVAVPLGCDREYNLHVTGKLTEWNDILQKAGIFDHDDHDIWGGTMRHNELTYVNTVRVSKLNATHPYELTQAEIEGRRQMKGLVKFFNRYVDGMKNAYICSAQNGIGIRETRRIMGQYVLTGDDVLSGRKFNDSIAKNGYCIDIHSPTGKSWNAQFIQSADACYDIPYRCLVPKNVGGLLIAGRCISTTHEALGSVRIMPPCMATGQAAGTAAAMAAADHIQPGEVDVKTLQSTLKKNDVIL